MPSPQIVFWVSIMTAAVSLLAALATLITRLDKYPRLSKAALVSTTAAPVAVFVLVAVMEHGRSNSLEYVRKTVGSLPLPTIVYGPGMKVVATNEPAARFFGKSREDMMGLLPANLNDALKPYVSNYADWAAEQTTRLALGAQGKLSGQAKVALHMTGPHPNANTHWCVTSEPLDFGVDKYTLTVLFQCP